MLEGKVALVTGASQGLGRALALAYARAGARLAINARREESIRPVAEEIARVGGRCWPWPPTSPGARTWKGSWGRRSSASAG